MLVIQGQSLCGITHNYVLGRSHTIVPFAIHNYVRSSHIVKLNFRIELRVTAEISEEEEKNS